MKRDSSKAMGGKETPSASARRISISRIVISSAACADLDPSTL
jgi:hypothetical protein